MPILCSRASVSLRLRSKSESSGVASVFCWLSDCSGYIEKHLFITGQRTGSMLTRNECKIKLNYARAHAHFDPKFQHQPSAHTQTFVCTRHTQPRPFICHGLTGSSQTHKLDVWHSTSAGCANVLTFFLTSFFFLSSSFLFFSSLIWARRCFLRSSSAFRSLLSDMTSYGAWSERTTQGWAAYDTAMVSL